MKKSLASSEIPKSLFIITGVLMVMLVLQFLLGLAVNLWLPFPSTIYPIPPALANETDAELPPVTVPELWFFIETSPALIAHICNGISIWLLLLVLLVRSIFAKVQVFMYASIVSIIFVSGAIVCGPLFVTTQLQDFSYLMAFSFLFAFTGMGSVFMFQSFPTFTYVSTGSGSTAGISGTKNAEMSAASGKSGHSGHGSRPGDGSSRSEVHSREQDVADLL